MANTTGNKFGGRTKGTPNKITTELRDKFKLLVENNIDNLQMDLDELEPKDRIKTILDISKFILPTLKSTELIQEKTHFTPVVINLKEWN